MSGNGLTFSCELESQLDTASPISLIKSKYIPPILIHNISDSGYEGINGSGLEIFGQIEARISIDDRRADGMRLRVVSDQAMQCDVILGRDSIRILDLGLIREEVKPIKENFTDEILNIESSLFEGSEVDKVNINCRLSSEIREKFTEKLQESYLRAEKPSGKIEGFVHSIPKGEVPFETVHIDHFGPVDRTNAAKKYVRHCRCVY